MPTLGNRIKQSDYFESRYEDYLPLRGKSIEFPNGDVLAIDVDKAPSGEAILYLGSVTNTGLIDTIEMVVDNDLSVDENLNNLYLKTIEKFPELEDEEL